MASSNCSNLEGLPLSLLPGAKVVFQVLTEPVFLSLFGWPGCWHLLGSVTPISRLPGSPKAAVAFSVPAFSCSVAKSWLGFNFYFHLLIFSVKDEDCPPVSTFGRCFLELHQ